MRIAAACLLLVLLSAGSAHAATITPSRHDDPASGGTTCVPTASDCSLRGAVAAAQIGDTVQLGSGDYPLSQGELAVGKNITIAGAGPSATTIRQTTQKRVIHVTGGTGLTLTGLTVTGGHVTAANGSAGTSVSPDGGSGGGAFGAGVDGAGTMTLTDVVVTGNSATGGDGGAGNSGTSPGAGGAGGGASGAGISGGTSLTLTRVAVTANVAISGSGGTGGNAGTTGTGGHGGTAGQPGSAGISMGIGSSLVARDTLIADNSAVVGHGGSGGGGGTTSGAGGGGGSGEPADGGGLFSNGTVSLTNVTFAANSAGGSDGGAGGVGRAVSNAANGGAGGAASGGAGGSIALLNGAQAHFASVTIATSSTQAGTAGVGGAGVHGGISGANGSDAVDEGGDLFVYSSTLTMGDTLIALGTGHTGSENCSIRGGSSFTTLGHNLDDRNQCVAVPAAGDLHDAIVALGPLQDNGGPTQTLALLPGSTAISAGAAPCLDAGGATLTADARGLPRSSPCDIGAFEGQAATLAAPTVTGAPAVGSLLSCSPGATGGDAPQTTTLEWLRDGAHVAAGSDYTVTDADAGHALSCKQTVANAFGTASARSAEVAIPAPPPPAAPPATAPTEPPVVLVPAIKGLKLSPSSVRNRHTTTITFSLSGRAVIVKFSLRRSAGGVRSGKQCVARSRRHPHGKACTRLVSVSGAPKATTPKLGAAKVQWKPSHLAVGSYVLTATPAGGKPVTAKFKVRKR